MTLAIGCVVDLPAPVHAGEVEIDISFNQSFDRVEPRPGLTTTRYEMAITLSSGGTVTHSERKSNIRNAQIFAVDKTMRLGKNEKLEWRVLDKDSLINIYDYKSFSRAILVTVHGTNCTAQIDFELKPGFSDYEYRSQPLGVPGVARSVRADGVSCTIGPSRPG
jgi:hypothetical protein